MICSIQTKLTNLFSSFMILNKSTRKDKKSIKKFYKGEHYSASFMGYDHCYTATYNNEIIGSVILSYVNKINEYALLHALYISPLYRNNGYANKLINYACNEHNNILCFADKSLDGFYKKNGFTEAKPIDIPFYWQQRFNHYSIKNTNLTIYI